MGAATDLFTVDDLELLPDDGNRHEVIEGDLHVSTSPTFGHQDLIMQLGIDMGSYLPRESHRQGRIRCRNRLRRI